MTRGAPGVAAHEGCRRGEAATDGGAPSGIRVRFVVGNELGDEVRARGAGGGEVEADEVEEAEGAEGGLVVGDGGRRGVQRAEAEVDRDAREALLRGGAELVGEGLLELAGGGGSPFPARWEGSQGSLLPWRRCCSARGGGAWWWSSRASGALDAAAWSLAAGRRGGRLAGNACSAQIWAWVGRRQDGSAA